MLNSDTATLRVIKNPEAQKALTDWFNLLSERYAGHAEKKINGRAWRAEIKRMEPPYDAMMSEGYNALRHRLSALPLILKATIINEVSRHNWVKA
jgi:CRISPR system Cascade subunit CasB